MQHSEFTRSLREHKLPPGVTFEQALHPEYWEHMADRLKIGDLIEVSNGDYSVDVVLRVVAVDPYGHWAQVVERGKAIPGTTLLASGSTDASGLTVHRDPVKGWRVMRGREELATHLPDEAAAIAKRDQISAPQPARRTG
jgi:hypothetical protein